MKTQMKPKHVLSERSQHKVTRAVLFPLYDVLEDRTNLL